MLITDIIHACKYSNDHWRHADSSELYWAINRTTPISTSNLNVPAETVQIFGIEITNQALREAAVWISQCAERNIKTSVAFVNTHCLNVTFRDDAYRRSLMNFDRVFGYGSGMRMSARSSGVRLRDNVKGADILPLICEEAERRDLGLFLFGHSDEIAWQAARTLSRCYQDLSICGTHAGHFSRPSEEDKVIDTINRSGAKILLVGLDVPLQEKWIVENRHRITVPVIAGIGGQIDYSHASALSAPSQLSSQGTSSSWAGLSQLTGHHIVGNAEYFGRFVWSLITRGGALPGKEAENHIHQ